MRKTILTRSTALFVAFALWLAAAAPAAAFDEHALITGQVALVATGPTSVAAARPGRTQITITNMSTTILYCGNSASLSGGLTTSNGDYLPGALGSRLTYFTGAEVDCIAATGTPSVSYSEVF